VLVTTVSDTLIWGGTDMSEESIKNALKDFGLTEKETEVYIFLAKYGAMKGGEIVKHTKTHRALVYRVLGSLQRKGLIESTLELPARFSAVSFETIIDLNIKKKIDEATLIKGTKEELLSYWKNISQPSHTQHLEKFAVIEGTHRIYSKLEQSVKDTKSQFLAILTVPSLLKADQSGLLDVASKLFSKSKSQLKFLIQISEQDVTPMKALIKRITRDKVNFIGRVPDFDLRPFPRMFIRDGEEVMFFLKSKADNSTLEKDDVCVWTNSRELNIAFSAVFDDYWHHATEIGKKIAEIEAGITSPETCFFKNAEEARDKYDFTLDSAKQDIMFLMPPESLIELSKNSSLLKSWKTRGILVRILAPITEENLKEALLLSDLFELRHIATNFLGTTIVDSRHLFQFKRHLPDKITTPQKTLKDTFYTNALEYVEKARTMFNDLWNISKEPSNVTLDSILDRQESLTTPTDDIPLRAARKIGEIKLADEEPVTEKSIIDRIMNGKKYEVTNPSIDLTRTYGFSGQAVIHPPKELGLPDFMVHAWHNDKQSSYGVEDYFVVYLWLPAPMGYMYVPVAVVGDVPMGATGLQVVWGGTPAGQNVRIVNKDELQVQLHGGNFFVGWTVPIPLPPTPFVLPPAVIMLEAFGQLRTKSFTANMPSGYKVQIEENSFEAFVTFYHPASKYSGPGTDGLVNRDVIMTTTPP
jgi:sugar-specific transcriptional regulator TrmB